MKEQEIEKLGDLIYNTLVKDRAIPIGNWAYITDIVSQVVYDAGYQNVNDIKRQFQEQIEQARKEAEEATLKQVVEAIEQLENPYNDSDVETWLHTIFERNRQRFIKAIGGLNETDR